ncbi:kinase-like protein [Hypoxylon sp. FL0890]|nr:kinase-like protein [Hypoxylon sp. FL0890]
MRKFGSDISINNPYVSRKHLVIYSVVYDLDNTPSQPPLIYVRDCQSLAGTYVDEICIGNKEEGASPGFYLSRDVMITIKPHWRFRVSLLGHYEIKSPLTAIQLKESNVGLVKHEWYLGGTYYESQLFDDRYIISNRILGSGAFASVHLAVDARTGRQLACKIHDLDHLCRFPHSQDLIRRILDETDILGKLRHPNLPTFVYAFRSRHTLYTFTELATGGDLFSMRLARGIFTENESKIVILQIINAILHLHEGWVAHRDLKPENILFATGPHTTGRIIVGDLGEVEYSQSHGLAVDIWSLGMIAVFLLAPDHHVAPSGFVKINQAAMDEWLDSVFEDPSHQDISGNCKAFIRSCLMHEPERRIKASEAKHHPWFQQQPGRRRFKFHMRENAETWKPVHFIAPPVQELPDLENIGGIAQLREQESAPSSSASATESGKRKPTDTTPERDNSWESPYFSASRSVESKFHTEPTP